jgi:hypothetical protein
VNYGAGYTIGKFDFHHESPICCMIHQHSILGDLVNDTVTVIPGLAASQQPIGVSYMSYYVYPHDGVLG